MWGPPCCAEDRTTLPAVGCTWGSVAVFRVRVDPGQRRAVFRCRLKSKKQLLRVFSRQTAVMFLAFEICWQPFPGIWRRILV